MANTLERIAKCRYKTEMDRRSCFWQVDLTAAAQGLLAFITPKGCVFKWQIMPLGGANAPAFFQELMNKNLYVLRRRALVQELISRGAEMEAHIDDMSLGTNTQEDHVLLLRECFIVCRENHLRIKLEKCEFIKEEVEYLGFEDERLMAPPVSTHEKLDLLNVPSPQEMPPSVCLDGVLLRSAAMDTDQETALIAFIDSIEGWDTSTRRRLRHYGYSHEHGGKNVQPTDPIPDSLRTVMENCQDLLRVNDIDSVLNQCTVADYPPSVGVIDHVGNFLLGKVVVMANLPSTVPMQFTPTEPTGGDRVDILFERWSIVAITGRARYKYQHGISAREYDLIRDREHPKGKACLSDLPQRPGCMQ